MDATTCTDIEHAQLRKIALKNVYNGVPGLQETYATKIGRKLNPVDPLNQTLTDTTVNTAFDR